MLKAPSVALRSILRITIPLLPFRIVPHVVGHAREEHRRFRLLLVLDAVHQVETVDVVFQLRGQLIFVLKKGTLLTECYAGRTSVRLWKSFELKNSHRDASRSISKVSIEFTTSFTSESTCNKYLPPVMVAPNSHDTCSRRLVCSPFQSFLGWYRILGTPDIPE